MKITFTLDEIQTVAQQVLEEAGQRKCLAFFAEMGVGKTTLINALCNKLKVADATSSPTYSIINEYETTDGAKVVHMDWYRLKDEDDALNAGVEDYMLGNNYCFIEWPERAEVLLPNECVIVRILLNEDESRLLTLSKTI